MMCNIFAEAEIREKDLAILIIQDILWLDCTMSDSKFMTVIQRFKDLPNSYAGFTLSVGLTLLNTSIAIIKELTSYTQLHHLVQLPFVLISFKVLAYARKVHLFERFYFI